MRELRLTAVVSVAARQLARQLVHATSRDGNALNALFLDRAAFSWGASAGSASKPDGWLQVALPHLLRSHTRAIVSVQLARNGSRRARLIKGLQAAAKRKWTVWQGCEV
jgi:hypothetical protein